MFAQYRVINRPLLGPAAALVMALAPALVGTATAQGYGYGPYGPYPARSRFTISSTPTAEYVTPFV